MKTKIRKKSREHDIPIKNDVEKQDMFISGKKKLKDKTIALFFTEGISLRIWHETGMIEREVAIYNKLSKYFRQIYFFTYGGKEDLKFKKYLADNITIVPKKYISNNVLYSVMLQFIHRKILKNIDIFKTNQMSGSWSAVLAKIIYGKKLIIRTGYMWSVNLGKSNPKSLKLYISKHAEKLAYRFADGVITTSQKNHDYVMNCYNPRCRHVIISNYVMTELFRPRNILKKKGSICFIGRLSREKNLFALFRALKGMKYTIDIIGSGGLGEELKKYAKENKINATFFGNIPNSKLPVILNHNEIFILPSLYENMPKTLLEAMACGIPVIGTDVDGINEVIKNNVNGLLCSTDSDSIRKTIINMMGNKKIRQKLGENVRKTIVENYSLDELIKKELNLMEKLA